MSAKKALSDFLTAATLITSVLALATAGWAAPKYTILHAFGAGKDGAGLFGGLVRDPRGNLYGTTSGGGPYGYGTVFELTPRADGKWREKVLHSFRDNDPNGDDPNCTLTMDEA
jgi:uncharacterized repeat protein (TIGR03803 family)